MSIFNYYGVAPFAYSRSKDNLLFNMWRPARNNRLARKKTNEKIYLIVIQENERQEYVMNKLCQTEKWQIIDLLFQTDLTIELHKIIYIRLLESLKVNLLLKLLKAAVVLGIKT